MPKLSNLRLLSSYSTRVEKPHFIVTGECVGTGNDGEPLLKYLTILNEIEIEIKVRVEYFHSIYMKLFCKHTDICSKKITYDHYPPDEFHNYDIYRFAGVYYSEPCCETFDYSLGHKDLLR